MPVSSHPVFFLCFYQWTGRSESDTCVHLSSPVFSRVSTALSPLARGLFFHLTVVPALCLCPHTGIAFSALLSPFPPEARSLETHNFLPLRFVLTLLLTRSGFSLFPSPCSEDTFHTYSSLFLFLARFFSAQWLKNEPFFFFMLPLTVVLPLS